MSQLEMGSRWGQRGNADMTQVGTDWTDWTPISIQHVREHPLPNFTRGGCVREIFSIQTASTASSASIPVNRRIVLVEGQYRRMTVKQRLKGC